MLGLHKKILTNNKNFAIINIENEREDKRMSPVTVLAIIMVVIGAIMIITDIAEATAESRFFHRQDWLKRHPQYKEDRDGNLHRID